MRTLIAALIFLLPVPAMAEAPTGAICGSRASFIGFLHRNHNEAPAYMGVTNAGKVVEILVSEAGTWTIIFTHPNGRTCMLGAGKHWETVIVKPKGEPS